MRGTARHTNRLFGKVEKAERFELSITQVLKQQLRMFSIHPSIGATAQIGPWPPLLRFLNLIIYTRGRTPLDKWSALDNASTYTGQHNTETRRQTSMLRAGFEPGIPVTKPPRPTPLTARPLRSAYACFMMFVIRVLSTYCPHIGEGFIV
jgi:hypothetical protein